LTIFGADKISGAPDENSTTVADLTSSGALDGGIVVDRSQEQAEYDQTRRNEVRNQDLHCGALIAKEGATSN
jgi:hypothetical protein